jgi:hypothetical protein
MSWLQELRETAAGPWEPVGTAAFLAASLGFGGLMVVAATSADGWIPLLDSVNLVFHEAGHPIFGLFGSETLGFLGGTLMQVLVPLIVGGAFCQKRQPLGAAVAAFWAGENGLNIARYMADARSQLLPLVGGGEHDWATLFGQWGCLARDTAIAGAVRAAGWMVMLGAWAWLAWRWHRSRIA